MPRNPWFSNNFLDSCAFDPKYNPEDKAALEIFRLYDEDELRIQLTHSNLKEIEHPNTPEWVKAAARPLIKTLEVNLAREERERRSSIHAVLTGNGKPEKMWADACHIFEAGKYGGYFITTDTRLLKLGEEIRSLCGAEIVLPTDFLELVRNSKRGTGSKCLSLK